MDRKLWFRAKRYGWGWTPMTWQGWLTILIYVISVVAILPNRTSLSDYNDLFFIFELISITLILLAVCYKKGEKPRWRWGGKD